MAVSFSLDHAVALNLLISAFALTRGAVLIDKVGLVGCGPPYQAGTLAMCESWASDPVGSTALSQFSPRRRTVNSSVFWYEHF